MIPTGLRKRGRCARILSAAVLCSIASVAYCRTVEFQQTPAQDRLFDNLLNPFSGWGGGGSSGGGGGSGRPYNMPDVAGFGMYPLWKFHKFDGLSLRPVPYGVDIGSGLPPVPPSPSYPTGFPGAATLPPPGLPVPVPVPVGAAAVPPPVYRDYGPPAMPPPAPYEPASTGPEGSYSNPPSQNYPPPSPQGYPAPGPQGYPSPAPQNYQAPPPPNYQSPPIQTINYQPQQYGGPSSPPSNYGNNAPTVNVAYVPAPGYNDGYNNAPPAYPESPAYKEQYPQQGYKEQYPAPGYGGPPPNYGGPAGYDGGMQYGASQQGAQFSAAPQDYGMPQPSGSIQFPSFAALENPMSVAYPPAAEPQQMEQQSFERGGYMKRRSSNPKAEKEIAKTESEQTLTQDNSFDSA